MRNDVKRNTVNLSESPNHVVCLAEDSIFIGLGMFLIAIDFTLLITEIVRPDTCRPCRCRRISSFYSIEFPYLRCIL
jgi:hypothetical protein